MIFGSKKYQINQFLSIGLLAIILTGCGGGGTENGGALGNNSSAAPVVTPSSTQASTAPSSLSTSKASVSSASTTSTSATSIPAQTSSSSSLSSYARSSRASSESSLEFTEQELIPEPSSQLDLPPSTPSNLKLQAASHNSTRIGWQESTDDIALSHYEVRRNDILIGTTLATELQFDDTSLTPNTYYTYKIRAIDSRGNGSGFSNALIVKTLRTAVNASSSSAALSSAASSSSVDGSSSSITASSFASVDGTSSTASSSSAISSAVTSSDSNNSSTSSSSSSAATAKNIMLKWIPPTQRENGEYMAPTDIGGYEVRYYSAEKEMWFTEIINDPTTNMIILTDTTTNDLFEIAAFDTNELYSRFIALNPQPVQ